METRRWDKETLYRLVREKLGDRLFLVVSNREPYVHTFSGAQIICNRPVSGLTEALDPVMRASGGTWIAQGTGDADRQVVDSHNRVAVPPEKPEYTLRRVWLNRQQVEGFYRGFSNEALWPLCHIAFARPTFRERDWQTYRKVNQVFADAVLEEVAGRKAVVLVQDYHFALLSGLIKEQQPGLTVGQFWHIPWPPYELFRTCPWREEILAGMLGNDLMGFHIRPYCDSFLDSVEHLLKAEVDRKKSTVTYRGRTTVIEPFPISVDFDAISGDANSPAIVREMETLRRELDLEGKLVGIGVDRIDHTKGILERLQAFDKFLEDNPGYREKVVFIQAGMPSRTEIESYKSLMEKTASLASSINQKHGTASWQPLVMLTEQLSYPELNALRRLADFCLVSSLHDGMNLVAKEYVAARADEDGVLILSEFAGAAAELKDALLINPYDLGAFSRSIQTALEMDRAEKRRRMKKMREIVANNNLYRWGADMVERLISLAGA